MLLIISGMLTPDVEDAGKLAKEYQDVLRNALAEVDLTTLVGSIIIFSTILDPNIVSTPHRDSVRYFKRDGSVRVAVGISHALWKSASHSKKLDLIAQNIAASIAKIGPRYLSEIDKEKLLSIIEGCRGKFDA